MALLPLGELRRAPAERREAAGQPQAHPAAAKSLALFYGNRRLQAAAVAMSAPMVFMQLGLSVHQIVELTREIVKKCVRGDALRAFQTAGEHMKNLDYIEGRLIANGADVASELADSLTAYQQNDFRTFGNSIGKALRKVLLSRSASAGLPEGLPGKLVLANVTTGVLRGFFGEGFALDIQVPKRDAAIHVDLHQCVDRNLRFFQSIWASTMLFYAQKASQDEQGTVAQQDRAPWGATLAVTMMQVPSALRRCGIGKEEEQMLMDSVRTLGSGTHYHLKQPALGAVTHDEMAAAMATTVKDWARKDWYQFGLDVGKLLQAMFVTVYSQKYEVDGSGKLRKRLLGTPAAPGGLLGGATQTRGMVGVLALSSLPLLVALLAVKGRQALMLRRGPAPQAYLESSAGSEFRAVE